MPDGTDRAGRGSVTSPRISVIGQSRRAHVRRIAAHLSDAGYEVDVRPDLSDASSGVTMVDLSAASSVDDSAIGDVSRFRSVPGRAVIVFTSSRDLHPVAAAFNAGADDMLIAPFTVEELLARGARAAAGNRPSFALVLLDAPGRTAVESAPPRRGLGVRRRRHGDGHRPRAPSPREDRRGSRKASDHSDRVGDRLPVLPVRNLSRGFVGVSQGGHSRDARGSLVLPDDERETIGNRPDRPFASVLCSGRNGSPFEKPARACNDPMIGGTVGHANT